MNIAVVGSINLDKMIKVDRIPKKGETINGKLIDYVPGGKGANQAIACARLGQNVKFYGCVGDDAAGIKLINNFKENGVSVKNIEIVKNNPSGQAIILIGENDNSIIVIKGANEFVDEDYINRHKEEILEADIIILQNEIPASTISKVIKMTYEKNKIIILNPAPFKKLDNELLNMVTYLTPNENEAELIFNTDNFKDILKKYSQKLIITKGDKGVDVCLDGKNILNIPSINTKVIDTTGAGDTFNGAFCAALALKIDLKDAIMFANIAAGLSIRKLGAQTGMPTFDEVMDIFNRQFAS